MIDRNEYVHYENVERCNTKWYEYHSFIQHVVHHHHFLLSSINILNLKIISNIPISNVNGLSMIRGISSRTDNATCIFFSLKKNEAKLKSCIYNSHSSTMIILFIVEKNVVPSVVKNDTINEIKNKYSMKRGNFQSLNERYSQSFTAEGLRMRRSISTVYSAST